VTDNEKRPVGVAVPGRALGGEAKVGCLRCAPP
jgi:hypothetical protein